MQVPVPQDQTTRDATARCALLAVGIASFVLMGAGQALFGPALPICERLLEITTAQAGRIVSAFWIGCFLGVAGIYVIGALVTPRAGPGRAGHRGGAAGDGQQLAAGHRRIGPVRSGLRRVDRRLQPARTRTVRGTRPVDVKPVERHVFDRGHRRATVFYRAGRRSDMGVRAGCPAYGGFVAGGGVGRAGHGCKCGAGGRSTCPGRS